MRMAEIYAVEYDRDPEEADPKLFSEGHLPLFQSGEKLPSYIKDHRKRLRQRFSKGGASAMPDYEMLELVLFRAIPRRDVKQLARALLEQFNDFNGVLSAPCDRLEAVKGVSLAVV